MILARRFLKHAITPLVSGALLFYGASRRRGER